MKDQNTENRRAATKITVTVTVVGFFHAASGPGEE